MRTWLKVARQNSGLTMKVLADKLDISESYYCSIEGGYRQERMDIAFAAKLSDILGITIEEISELEAAAPDALAAEKEKPHETLL